MWRNKSIIPILGTDVSKPRRLLDNPRSHTAAGKINAFPIISTMTVLITANIIAQWNTWYLPAPKSKFVERIHCYFIV